MVRQPVVAVAVGDEGVAAGPHAQHVGEVLRAHDGRQLLVDPVGAQRRGVRRAPAGRPLATNDGRISKDVTTAGRPTGDTSPPAAATSKELNTLRDDYDNLSLRGGVIDDTLNLLWEQMKPDSPRLDMVTHQRRLRTSLTRSKEALARRDVSGARRYLESARGDLVALEQFLNR